jgi:hypothetical protein
MCNRTATHSNVKEHQQQTALVGVFTSLNVDLTPELFRELENTS